MKKIEIKENQIKKGDKLTVTYSSEGVDYTLEGVAEVQTWRGWANDYGVALVGHSNYEIIMKEVGELPTETGSIILVKDYDSTGKEVTATAILHGSGLWYYFVGTSPVDKMWPQCLSGLDFEILRRGY